MDEPPRYESTASARSRSVALSEATYVQLAEMVSLRLSQDSTQAERRLRDIEVEEKALEEQRQVLEDLERRIFTMSDPYDEIVELNVGGQHMSTTRAVLCTVEGSLLGCMFSGSWMEGIKRDKDGKVFLDVDPPLFSRILSHLRLCRAATPECPAPPLHVPEEMRPEYELIVKYLGLEEFMFPVVRNCGDIFAGIADGAGVCQGKLQTHELVKIILATTGGVPADKHEEVLGVTGLHERSLENSYGSHPGVITIKFLQHRVKVEGMQLRAKLADIPTHMSESWDFHHGSNAAIRMSFKFTKQAVSTGRLPVAVPTQDLVDEVSWRFPSDFCLEHIVLYGGLVPKSGHVQGA